MFAASTFPFSTALRADRSWIAFTNPRPCTTRFIAVVVVATFIPIAVETSDPARAVPLVIITVARHVYFGI
jgi:hypothetical protein